jgi:hypothetical protein
MTTLAIEYIEHQLFQRQLTQISWGHAYPAEELVETDVVWFASNSLMNKQSSCYRGEYVLFWRKQGKLQQLVDYIINY